MKLTPPSFRPRARARQRGWALLVVLTLSMCALLLMASVMAWANQNATNTSRNNETFAALYAAEAATEKALASMSLQYQSYGFNLVNQNLTNYSTNIPTSTDGSYWTNFVFSGGNTQNQILVFNSATSITNVLSAPYAGLTFVGNTYSIIANATMKGSMNGILQTVGQSINLGTIPLFQFAIFFQNDMEIEPGANMTVTGTAHGNANTYLYPGATLTFNDTLSSSGHIFTNESPLDLRSPGGFGNVSFGGLELNGVDPLNLPVGTNTVGTNNALTNAYGILTLPLSGQTPNSQTGTNLLYNRADMVVIISNNNTISVTTGPGVTGTPVIISNNQWSVFMNTNGTFVDQRDDSVTVQPVVFNVSNLVQWSSTNTVLYTNLNAVRPGEGNIQSIYIADLRTRTNGSGAIIRQPGIVLSNGAALPPQGLSIATPDPVYIIGNWNTQLTNHAGVTSDANSNETSNSLPSAIFADAITVLSPSWNPANSAAALSSRAASSDTVNAAFFMGNVPSSGVDSGPGEGYSGGVENFPRFLEDWSNQTFYYNGSMVQMFSSQIATNAWPNTGTVYNPPTRKWAFDQNFNNPAKQPPMTPQIITVQRGQWAMLKPYSTTITNISMY